MQDWREVHDHGVDKANIKIRIHSELLGVGTYLILRKASLRFYHQDVPKMLS